MKTWIIRKHDEPNAMYVRFAQFGPVTTSKIEHAQRFRTMHAANDALTHDMKHDGFIAVAV